MKGRNDFLRCGGRRSSGRLFPNPSCRRRRLLVERGPCDAMHACERDMSPSLRDTHMNFDSARHLEREAKPFLALPHTLFLEFHVLFAMPRKKYFIRMYQAHLRVGVEFARLDEQKRTCAALHPANINGFSKAAALQVNQNIRHHNSQKKARKNSKASWTDPFKRTAFATIEEPTGRPPYFGPPLLPLLLPAPPLAVRRSPPLALALAPAAAASALLSFALSL